MYKIGAGIPPKRTMVPASEVSTMPVFGSTEKETPVAGPRPLPLIATISPGEIAPDEELAAFVTDVTAIVGAAAVIDSEAVIVWGLFVAPGAIKLIAPL